MNKIIILLFFFIKIATGFAQKDTAALYLRFPVIPSFKINNVADSSYFTKSNLQKKKPVIIILFSPDCEHCQVATKELIKKIDLFQHVQILMVSSLDYDIIKKFYQEYNIHHFPVITMGRDAGYYLGTFYRVTSFPSVFVYNKKGDFIKTYSGHLPVDEIARLLK